MAIISISRIQQRRGLRADLPASLNEAEFGWCLDTRELFIGNGNTYTGNSQVLTQWSPNDQIIKHTYVGDTGVSALTGPTIRTLGSILDDTLCVKDYGAVGDGITDDTDAIQAAIADEWARISANPAAYAQSRNPIYFPAGNYLITATIKLYPYITLMGDGIDRSIITLQAGYVGPVLRTADSLGQTGANIGTNGGILPTHITVSGFTFDSSIDPPNTMVLLQRCTNTNMDNCKLIGAWQPGDAFNSTGNGITIESIGTATSTEYLNFNNIIVNNVAFGLYSEDPIRFVNVTNSSFVTCYTGIGLIEGADSGPSYVKISNSIFRAIDSYGLYATTTGEGITSSNNNYVDVGNEYNRYAIYWSNATSSCSSIGDVFDQINPSLYVYNGSPSTNVIFDAQLIEFTNTNPTPDTATILPGQTNASTGITFSLLTATNMLTAWVDYSLSLGSYRKNGRLSIISDTVTVQLTDTSNELNTSESVVFGAIVSGNNIVIRYTSTGSTNGMMSFITTYWTT